MTATFLFRTFRVVIALLTTAPAFCQDVDLRAKGNQKWFRGNMHTHSLWSDGDHYPEMIAAWYREHGYQFLVFTDHNTLHNKERWIDIEKSKGGRKAFDALSAAFPGDWVVSRRMADRDEVRLKTFEETFAKLAVPQEYLLIQGEEITDRFKTHQIHLCATNMAEMHAPTGGDDVVDVMQRNIEVALARRERTGVLTLVHINHPNFVYSITAEQMMKVVGENFFEVYNGHSSVHNSGDDQHASTEKMWDIINTFRLSQLKLPVMYGLATDDGHDYFESRSGKGSQPGRGWVVVLAETLTPDALVEALEAGRFYSSSGVKLQSISYAAGQLNVEVSPEQDLKYRIDFIGTKAGFDATSTAATDDESKATSMTRRYSQDVGAVLKSVDGTSATYTVDGTELYIRAVVTSSRPHPNPSEPGEFERAWIQPIVLPSR